MKAVVVTRYGGPDVLAIQEISKPEPKDNEIQIKIEAVPVSAADMFMRQGVPVFSRLFVGLTKPKASIPGTCFSGIVEKTGAKVTLWKPGDEICGETGLTFGACAEYACIPEDGLIIPKPENLSFEEAATLCDGVLTSYSFLTDITSVKAGEKVLIIGAAGSLGTAATRIASELGAEVTGTCSASNFELVKEQGVNHVIDYNKEDFTNNGKLYDVIYDTVGKSSFNKSKRSLSPEGRYLTPVLTTVTILLQMMWTSKFSKKKAIFSATGLRPVPELKKLLTELSGWIEEGKIKPVMDKVYTLDDIVAAHEYVMTGHKRGNVVVLP